MNVTEKYSAPDGGEDLRLISGNKGYPLDWDRPGVLRNSEAAPSSISPQYRIPIGIGVCFQAAFLLFGVFAIDSVVLLRCVLYSIVAYWFMAGIVIFRRPKAPTKWDLICLRSGFVVVFSVGVFAAFVLLSSRNLH